MLAPDDASELGRLQPEQEVLKETVRTMLHEAIEEELTPYLGNEAIAKVTGDTAGTQRVGELALRVL